MTELSKKAAQQLNALEKKLEVSAQRLDDEQQRYDALWTQVYHLFDLEVGENAPARFVCDDGYVVGRQAPRVSPTINASKLQKLVERHLSPMKAKRLLNRVLTYEPHVDQKALAVEVEAGRISDKIVGQCVTIKESTPRRERHPASKKDKTAIEAGVLELDESEEEETA